MQATKSLLRVKSLQRLPSITKEEISPPQISKPYRLEPMLAMQWVRTGAHEQELATPILSLCHGIFID